MKAVDKFLIVIVGGVVLLVIVAFVAVLRRPPPTFLDENTAAGVAHNYLLALQQKDYARAYGYLSPSLRGYPSSLNQFVGDIRNNDYGFPQDYDSITLEIESSRQLETNPEMEEVSVRETRSFVGRIFGPNQYSSEFEMELQRENGAWKIVASNRYFLRCWTDKDGCG